MNRDMEVTCKPFLYLAKTFLLLLRRTHSTSPCALRFFLSADHIVTGWFCPFLFAVPYRVHVYCRSGQFY